VPDALPRDFNQINVLQYCVLFTQKTNESPTLQPSRLMSASRGKADVAGLGGHVLD